MKNPEASSRARDFLFLVSDDFIFLKKTMAEKDQVAAAPPGATTTIFSTQPPTTTVLLRGPLVLAVSLWFLILPALLNSTPRTQLSILALFLGTLLTLLDCTAAVQHHLYLIKQRLRYGVNQVVLDDVLKSIFAPDTGWLAVLVGTWVGTAGMYALPLDEEQRVRLFGSGLAGFDPTADPEEVLLRPGGLMRLLPEAWRGVDGAEKKEAVAPAKIPEIRHADNNVPVTSVGRDMSWDHDDDDSVTADATDDSDSSQGVQHAFVGNARSAAAEQIIRPRSQLLHPATPRTTQPEDPVTAAVSIISDLFGRVLDRSLQSVDKNTVQTTGIASALALAVQLRRSPSARSALWSVLQGTAALGLAGTAVGAVALLEAKTRRIGESDSARTPTRASSARQDSSSSSASVSDDCVGGGPALSAVIDDGMKWLRSIAMSAKSPAFIRRIVEDERFRRGLQGAVAVLVLLYFRRRKKIALQKPSSRGGLYA